MEKVFVVYDSKVEAYLKPMHFKTKGEAIRAVSNALEDEKTMFHKYPEDFTLFEVAEYDELTGTYRQYDARVNVAGLWELKRERKTPEQLPLTAIS